MEPAKTEQPPDVSKRTEALKKGTEQYAHLERDMEGEKRGDGGQTSSERRKMEIASGINQVQQALQDIQGGPELWPPLLKRQGGPELWPPLKNRCF